MIPRLPNPTLNLLNLLAAEHTEDEDKDDGPAPGDGAELDQASNVPNDIIQEHPKRNSGSPPQAREKPDFGGRGGMRCGSFEICPFIPWTPENISGPGHLYCPAVGSGLSTQRVDHKPGHPCPKKRVQKTEQPRGSLGTERKWRIVSLPCVKPAPMNTLQIAATHMSNSVV